MQARWLGILAACVILPIAPKAARITVLKYKLHSHASRLEDLKGRGYSLTNQANENWRRTQDQLKINTLVFKKLGEDSQRKAIQVLRRVAMGEMSYQKLDQEQKILFREIVIRKALEYRLVSSASEAAHQLHIGATHDLEAQQVRTSMAGLHLEIAKAQNRLPSAETKVLSDEETQLKAQEGRVTRVTEMWRERWNQAKRLEGPLQRLAKRVPVTRGWINNPRAYYNSDGTLLSLLVASL